MPTTKCAIWGTDADEFPKSSDFRDINSPRAGGKYRISGSALAEIGSADPQVKLKLTSWIVDQHRLGVESPQITGEIIVWVGTRPHRPILERANMLLLFLEHQNLPIGQVFSAFQKGPDSAEYENILACSGCRNSDELFALAGYCQEQGWLAYSRDVVPDNRLHHFVLKPLGLAHLEKLAGTNIASSEAFVAMRFDGLMSPAYDNGIRVAIEQAGYEPLRIDELRFNDKIDDAIIAAIRRAKFMVADFTHGATGVRGGVYYEAGFAHGLGIPVIFTCKASNVEHLHFDTRQYNHILWSSPEDLRTQLQARIEATVGDGPLKKRKPIIFQIADAFGISPERLQLAGRLAPESPE